MKSIKLSEGNLEFKCVEGIDEFWQRILNSLKIYNTECFYNEKLGLDIRLISEQKVSEYKLEHIVSKLQEWYKDEIEGIDYEILSEDERTLKARVYITHKNYGKTKREVVINE